MKRITFILFFFICFLGFSQTDSGDLEAYLQNYLANIPGDSGDDFTIPTNQELTDFESCVTALLNNDISTARTEATKFNYQIVEYTDTGQNSFVSYLLEEKSPSNKYWGSYVFNATLTTKLVIQAPHAIYDFNTGKQGAYIYTRYMAGFLFLNGTHRCNHSQASTCSGTTSVCAGSPVPFRISDLAHNHNSVYQKATEIVTNMIPNATFVQLHGFTKLETDPYVIMSNGTGFSPTGTDHTLAIETALLNEDNSLTFKIAHRDNWTRLIGSTNTQGRFVNNSANPCSTSATEASGRFVHIEQEKSKLRQDATGWEKMLNALTTVFNPTFSTTQSEVNIVFQSENPFSNAIEFSAENVNHISLYSVIGKELYSSNNDRKEPIFFIDTKHLSKGMYLLKVKTSKGYSIKKLIKN